MEACSSSHRGLRLPQYAPVKLLRWRWFYSLRKPRTISAGFRFALMHRTIHSDRKEAALYWSAVSLIICEGLPIEDAAHRLNVDAQRLRGILEKREAVCSQEPSDELWQ